MRVLLDTVTFIWAVHSPERLSRKAMATIQAFESLREMSAISLSEIAIKQTKGKLDFASEDVIAGIADLQLRILPYTTNHAYHLFDLPSVHVDPFDRQIISQALAEDIPVITSDSVFKRYRGLKVIW
jgi:PIN domain nuclease of toxin-antitoxin system